MESNENERYKALYYHAFNRYTDLMDQIRQIQRELEELYLQSEPEEEQE